MRPVYACVAVLVVFLQACKSIDGQVVPPPVPVPLLVPDADDEGSWVGYVVVPEPPNWVNVAGARGKKVRLLVTWSSAVRRCVNHMPPADANQRNQHTENCVFQSYPARLAEEVEFNSRIPLRFENDEGRFCVLTAKATGAGRSGYGYEHIGR